MGGSGGGGGGGSDVGSGRGISWYDPLSTESRIFVFCDKAFPTYGQTDRRTERPSYRDARTHLKTENDKQEKKRGWKISRRKKGEER